jgi:hypothetical protein
MLEKVDVSSAVGPIRIRVSSNEPVTVRIAGAPIGVRVLGSPGPQGETGPEGPQGEQGEPGITILPTDAPINGGFF